MHYMINYYKLLPGDRIVEPKSNLELVQHHAIYLGSDLRGTDWIAENKIGFGVRVITADQYFRDVIKITRIERFTGDGNARRLAVQKALKMVGLPYSLINFNCEHFANYVQHDVAKSDQVAGGIFLGLTAALLIAVFAD